jgi:lysophospholipase L1-like esterase
MLTFGLLPVLLAAFSQAPVNFTITADWEVQVGSTRLPVRPPRWIAIQAEKHVGIPVFNPKAGGWVKGAQLMGVRAQETTSPHLIDKESFSLRAGPEAEASLFTRGVDYEVDLDWGTFGRLAGGKIEEGQAVYASYRHTRQRLDLVVVDSAGKVVLRQGDERAAAPARPELQPGERALGTVYLSGMTSKLEAAHLFPVTEQAYPEVPIAMSATVKRVMERLKAGEKLRILAWGDSVTDGAYLANKSTERWQEQFVARLRERFPKAQIELMTQAWGGRNTGSYLAEPPGSVHNYRETVLGVKPDLIVSEFVNDAGLKPEQVEERYSKLLADFKEIGAEWIILTPHYVRPDWMGLTKERDIDEDPRPYVLGLRRFAAKHDVGLADASLRYGRLWRQGIPYNTLMLNAINHPDARGMRIFADALMALFQ